MDEAVTKTRGAVLTLFAAAIAAISAAGAQAQVHAQALQDPTRPPAAAMAGAAASPEASAAGPRLQSILVAREAGGRHLAVIDGETVRLGEQFRGARVARIGDNEVELVRGSERQILRLYALEAPGLTPVRGQAATQARR